MQISSRFTIAVHIFAFEEEIPAGRFGTPQEVADMVWNLVNSPSYLTGQIIGLDGGYI